MSADGEQVHGPPQEKHAVATTWAAPTGSAVRDMWADDGERRGGPASLADGSRLRRFLDERGLSSRDADDPDAGGGARRGVSDAPEKLKTKTLD